MYSSKSRQVGSIATQFRLANLVQKLYPCKLVRNVLALESREVIPKLIRSNAETDTT